MKDKYSLNEQAIFNSIRIEHFIYMIIVFGISMQICIRIYVGRMAIVSEAKSE